MPADAQLVMVTPIGSLRLHARNQGLSGIVILAEEQEPASRRATEILPATGVPEPVLRQAATELAEYFAGFRKDFAVPLELPGWPQFSARVMAALRAVPYGETLSYGELAARVGSPRAARAVGQVMAANPLPIIIPCHRVVASHGLTGGYSGGGGLRTKRWLLEWEQRHRLRS
ncbi:MAG: methylated-DNA--[protein]-cysteine S-methyltransferase [Desulfuromonadales bacterium]|nr:methylated-DNA--[protein]-cysteine S-methyltransferase [Desulfuromonadales bacterium]